MNAAIDKKVDGIIVTLAKPAAMKSALARAQKAGIPVITVNSGSEESKKFGALTHIGQDETIAGEAVGEELNERGREQAICVLHEQGNVGHEQRCDGVEDLRRQDPAALRQRHQHAGRASPPSRPSSRPTSRSTRSSPWAPLRRHAVKAKQGAGSRAEIDTFDLNAKVAAGLEDGTLGFAVDQQPYLRGCEAVDLLWLYKYNADVLGGGRPGAHRAADHHQGRRRRAGRLHQAGHPMSAGTDVATADERILQTSPLRKLLGRPELGSVVGAIAVFVFFAFFADSFLRATSLSTVLYAASTIGIMAVPVALLMIGGEFDLSPGVMVTSSALVSSMFSYQMTANVWVGVGVSLLVTLAIGAFNGFMLTRTKLPSFIITLGTFLMLTGLNLGFTKLIDGTVSTKTIADMEGFPSAREVFASTLTIGGVGFQVTILWWLALVAVASWILLRTRAGNWIFAVGGNRTPPAR